MELIRSAKAIVLALVVGACAAPPLEQQIVNDAADAIGGRQRVLAVRTLVVEGEGTSANLGQDMTMEASGQQFNLTGYKRATDLANLRWRVEQTRTPNFLYFQGQQPTKQVFGVDGSAAASAPSAAAASSAAIAYNVAANGNASRAANAVARDRLAETFHHPLNIVRAALDPASKLTNPRTAGNERVVDVTTANGFTFTLAADATTHLPTRVVSMTDNPNLGDVAIETSFADYQEVSGLKLPTRMATKTDKYPSATLRVTRQAIDADAGNLEAPEPAKSAAAVAGPAAPTVTVEELGKGIWLLAGQSHHSALIEFADHLTLIEAPQHEARTLAVIAKARELRPGKPLTEVINTHHHFDHSAGIRAAVAEGLSIITHKANEAFFTEAAARPHTIAPDALARSPKPIKVVAVDDAMTLKDASMTAEIYHIAGNPHGDAILMVYFPREQMLIEVDAYSPGPVQPYAANLVENVQRRKLRVARVVPLHGTASTYAELIAQIRGS